MKHNPLQIKWKGGENPTEKSHLVGAHLPPQMAEQLSCLALYKNKSRSQLIREALQHFLITEQDSESIIAALAKRIAECWEKERAEIEHSDDKAFFIAYKKALQAILKKRGIPDNLITKIFQMVNAKVDIDEER